MVSKDILQVKTLGKLSITDGRVAFPQEKGGAFRWNC